MKNIILSIILCVMCISCSTNKYTASNLSGEWQINQVLDNKISIENEEVPFIGFQKEEARFYGSTGCNSFFGEFKSQDEKQGVSFSNVGSTKKLCDDMTIEDAIFKAFSLVSEVEYNKTNMTLKDNNGNTLMELSLIK